MCVSCVCHAAYNEEIQKTLGDKRLQEVLLKVDGAANREQVGLIGSVRLAREKLAWSKQHAASGISAHITQVPGLPLAELMVYRL